MRIPCPFCGERGSEEFVSVGLVPGPRPPAEAPLSAFVDYQHLRDNPAGTVREHWQHVYGLIEAPGVPFALHHISICHHICSTLSMKNLCMYVLKACVPGSASTCGCLLSLLAFLSHLAALLNLSKSQPFGRK